MGMTDNFQDSCSIANSEQGFEPQRTLPILGAFHEYSQD